MRNIAKELFSIASERDQQKWLGPSDLGDPCDACVARKFSGLQDPDGDYPMGGKIGTAVHAHLEALSIEHMPEALSEAKWYIGEIPGYGEIRGTADHYVDGQLTDFKTTLKKKMSALSAAYDHPQVVEGEPLTHKEARYKLRGYVGQAHLYALGLENAGHEVNSIVVNFIPRDSSTYDDIRAFEYDYDPSFAQIVLDRAKHIWDNLENELWKSQALCYACSTR